METNLAKKETPMHRIGWLLSLAVMPLAVLSLWWVYIPVAAFVSVVYVVGVMLIGSIIGILLDQKTNRQRATIVFWWPFWAGYMAAKKVQQYMRTAFMWIKYGYVEE
jgi:FtsH-binding integral membrane protein